MYKVSVLVDNCVGESPTGGLWAEHGLSYWIETNDGNILFDTGASGTVLLHNAQLLGLDLSSCSAIALSHGHLDHVGGLEAVLPLTPQAALFMHPDAVNPKYSGTAGKMRRSDSIFFVEKRFQGIGRKVIERKEAGEIFPGVWVTGEVPRVNSIENTGGRFYVDPELSDRDDILDDQSLFITTPQGSIVILGCAHAGIINTLEYVKKLTSNTPISCVIGGTHLENASQERLEWTINSLKKLSIAKIHPCHCTGTINSVLLSQAIGGHSLPAYTGFCLKF